MKERFEGFKFRQSTLALGAMAIGVTLYELYCDEDELITHRTQELLNKPETRYLTAGFIGMTAIHLMGGFKNAKWLDPYHHAGRFRKYTRPDERCVVE